MLPKTIVEEHFFVAELDGLKSKYSRIYDVKDAVSWELAKRPDAGTLLPGEILYRVYNTFSIGSTPTFTILYKYDEQHDADRVYLLGIRPINNNVFE